MYEMSRTKFSQVYNDDKSKIFRIQTEWEDQSFTISILNESSSWFARVTEDVIDNLADQHQVNVNDYLSNVKNYICNDQSNVSFDVKDKQFIIYRTASTGKLRLKYFFIKLEKVAYQKTVESIIDTLADKYRDTLENLNKIEEEKNEAITQQLLLEKKCEEFVELKQKSDLQMYSAFALVLNEKKHRIRYLTELLECPKKKKQIEDTRINDELSDSGEELPINRKLEVLSDSEPNNTEGYDTDDEKKVEMKQLEPIPSTSTTNYDFLGGDSPPPLLPKRIKIETKSVEEPVFNVSNKKLEKMEVQVVNNENSEEEENCFSTQDLLDRM